MSLAGQSAPSLTLPARDGSLPAQAKEGFMALPNDVNQTLVYSGPIMTGENVPPTSEIALREMDGEPRVRDVDLAEKLGFDRPRKIRELIERNMAEVEMFGSSAPRRGAYRGKAFTEYFLNEEQALLVSVLSNAPNAAAVRAMLIRVFVAYRRGQLKSRRSAYNSRPLAHPGREARLQWGHAERIMKEAGLTGNQKLLRVNSMVTAATGFDTLEALGLNILPAPQPTILLNPTEIGQRSGGLSARRVNNILAAHGYQTDLNGHWEPTSKGLDAGAVMIETERNNGTGNARQLRWSSSIVDTVRNIAEMS